MRYHCFFLFLLILKLITKTRSQDLEAKRSAARLPSRRYATAACYDGDDYIYVLGGMDGFYVNDILRYSISSDTLVTVAYLPRGMRHGTAICDNDNGYIYYLGGYLGDYETKNIYKFNRATNSTVLLSATLPNFCSYGNAIKYNVNSTKVFIFDGHTSDQMVMFDMETETAAVVGTVPQPSQKYYYYMSLLSNNLGSAYLFGSPAWFSPGTLFPTVKINLDNLDTFVGSVGHIDGMDLQKPHSVWDGTHAYIIDGFRKELSQSGILKINPETEETEFLPVRNFPGSMIQFSGTSPVYVEKLDRIYVFGGRSHYIPSGGTYHSEVWYIDLNPPPATTTTEQPTTEVSCPELTCANKPNGRFPHPYNCAMYILCFQGSLIQVNCPEDLLFDPVLLQCNNPESVECIVCVPDTV